MGRDVRGGAGGDAVDVLEVEVEEVRQGQLLCEEVVEEGLAVEDQVAVYDG